MITWLLILGPPVAFVCGRLSGDHQLVWLSLEALGMITWVALVAYAIEGFPAP